MRAKANQNMKTGSSHSILLVAPAPPPYGGMALQAQLLQNLLRGDGNAVDLFASNFSFGKRLRFLGRIPALRTAIRAILMWWKLWGRSRQVEIVHIFAASWIYFFAVVLPAALIGRLRGKRVILNYRGGEADDFLRTYGRLTRPVFGWADVVTAPSGFLAQVIRTRVGKPVTVIPNILDTSRFPYRQRTSVSPKMLVARHLEKIYDVESVLRAFQAAQRRHPEATLWIAGTGSQEPYLRGLVSDWNLNNVSFLGHVPHGDLPAIYDACDILVNASRVDNFPGALIEASGAGLVVVSTGAGGIPFIYKNEETALLVKPGDWFALAHAIERVLDDPPFALGLAKRAASVARDCDWREVRKSLYEVYAFPLADGQDESAGVTRQMSGVQRVWDEK